MAVADRRRVDELRPSALARVSLLARTQISHFGRQQLEPRRLPSSSTRVRPRHTTPRFARRRWSRELTHRAAGPVEHDLDVQERRHPGRQPHLRPARMATHVDGSWRCTTPTNAPAPNTSEERDEDADRRTVGQRDLGAPRRARRPHAIKRVQRRQREECDRDLGRCDARLNVVEAVVKSSSMPAAIAPANSVDPVEAVSRTGRARRTSAHRRRR